MARMLVAEVSRQTTMSAWHGNVFLFLMVGFAVKDMAMSNCTDQKGGATVVLAEGNCASSKATVRWAISRHLEQRLLKIEIAALTLPTG